MSRLQTKMEAAQKNIDSAILPESRAFNEGVLYGLKQAVAREDELIAALRAMIAASEEPDPESKSPRVAMLAMAWAKARAAIDAEGAR